MLGSVAVSVLALIDMFHTRSLSSAREDGKTAEILREVNEKLEDITKQQMVNDTRLGDVIQRLALVEQSDKEAHQKIADLWKKIYN
jgi:hypothetical protein